MMRTATELHDLAWRALVRELGLADTLRYRILFQPGAGNYCRERQALFSGIQMERWLDDLARWEQQRAAKE
jgi:hypothetical protein